MFIRDLETWIKGLIGAGISGATAAISTSLVAPETFNFGSGLKKLGTVCLVAFVVSIAKYLSTKPLPESDKGK